MIADRPVIADMSVKLSRRVGFQDSSDSSDPLISGSVFMPNGELVLCDWNNESIKVFSIDFILKEQTKLASKPWDIDITTDDEVVISFPYSKSLMFLKVSPRLRLGSSIKLDQECRGVAVDDGSIFVSFSSGEVRILDRAGNQLKNIYNSLNFSRPYYISVPKPGMLLVSEHGANTIRMLRNGKEVYSYKHSGLINPCGMYIDGEENVFTCGYRSHNVHVIDSNGKHKKIFRTADDPHTISFRPSDNTLIVVGIKGLLVANLGYV